jgi:UDP-N-acetylglucosamine--N-acetylmuramyl-(pentapeptide) pyrophosphoryl-undecaprenol N-acetylglucosamine transferase
MPNKAVLIMAGGTGGHVYPALAIAEHLREQGVKLFWLGTKTGLESHVAPENGFAFFTIDVSGLRGKNFSRWLLAPFTLIRALIQSLKVIINIRPSAVIGLGGFVSGPGGLAAWLLRKPLFIHEQNSIAGLTNRLLAPFAQIVMQGFPDSLQGKKVVTTGNPVRNDILIHATSPVDRINSREGQALNLLVLGGSLGARALNEIMPDVMSNLPDDVKIDLWHQTGKAHFDSTLSLYKQSPYGVDGKIVAYIDTMSEAYLWADIILCRAGALTISEISIMGLASILVPYPYAVDDHQTSNARYLSDAGAAILIPQEQLKRSSIVEILSRFYRERESLKTMAMAALNKSMPDATRLIGNLCMESLND